MKELSKLLKHFCSGKATPEQWALLDDCIPDSGDSEEVWRLGCDIFGVVEHPLCGCKTWRGFNCECANL